MPAFRQLMNPEFPEVRSHINPKILGSVRLLAHIRYQQRKSEISYSQFLRALLHRYLPLHSYCRRIVLLRR